MILKFRAEVTSVQPQSNETAVVRLEPRYDKDVPRGQALETGKTYKPDGNLIFRTNNPEVLRKFPIGGIVMVTVDTVEVADAKAEEKPEK